MIEKTRRPMEAILLIFRYRIYTAPLLEHVYREVILIRPSQLQRDHVHIYSTYHPIVPLKIAVTKQRTPTAKHLLHVHCPVRQGV